MAPLFSHNTSDESSWRVIGHWHKDCLDNHVLCNDKPGPKTWLSPVDKTWLPTRLTDVGKDQDRDMHVILTAKLKAPSDLSTSYLALSHCWGKDAEFKKLTKANEKDFRLGVPTAELAKDFRDAICATRQLGFRYIWIDCLCILQGEDGDVLDGARLMNLVDVSPTGTKSCTSVQDRI